MKKRVVSLLLCLIMALSLIPTTAFAVGTSSQDDGISLTSIVKPDGQSYYTYEFYLSSDSSEPYSTQIVKEGDTLYQPATPTTEEGKVFTGWYDEKGNLFTGFGKVDEITESDTIKLTARIEDGYYVFFKKTDGTVIDTKTGTTGTEISLNSVSFPVEADQAITGWYKDESLTESASNPVIISTSNISLYAKVETGHWITFDSDGGSYVAPAFFATSKNTEKPNDPAKPGYAFAGWYNGGTKYTFGSPLTADIALTAKWTAQNGVKYTVIHWQENANDNGYSLKDTETMTGKVGAQTNAAAKDTKRVKDYNGFTAQTIEQKTIAGNGSTIVNVYYKRNVYVINFYSSKNPQYTCGKLEHEHRFWCYDFWDGHLTCDKEEHRHSDSCVKPKHKITAKYGAYIRDQWPGGGWYVNPNGTKAQTSIDVMPLGGTNFYGKQDGYYTQTAKYYTEVLPGNETSGTPKSDGRYYKLKYTDTTKSYDRLTVTDEDRYPITGFTCNERLSTKNDQYYNGAEFYYTRNSYNIVFMNNGQEKTVSKKYEESIADANYTPTTPPAGKEGYQFVGWYDNELCEGKAYDFTGKTMPAQNITLYAKWEEPVHTVTVYKTDKTTEHYKFENVSHNDTIDVTKIPTYEVSEGYEFLGWVLLEDGTEDGTPFNFNTEITRDYELYAKIGSMATYTVTYDANDGSGTMADNTKYAEGAIASVMANGFTPPNDDKVFLGWSTTASGSVAYYANSQLKIEKQNVILYAIWGDKDSTVTLTYNANYGEKPATNTIYSIKNNAKVTLKQFTELFPARDGYRFTEWNTQANGSGTSFAAGREARVDKVKPNVLYAQWEQLTGSLTIKKVVEGVTLDEDKTFQFQLYTKGTDEYVPYGRPIAVTVEAGGTSGSTTVSVPTDMYFVQEIATSAAIDNYSVTTAYERVDGPIPVLDGVDIDGTAAVVTESGNTTVKVTNRYNQITGTLTISKELVGLNATDFDKPFSFTVWKGTTEIETFDLWTGHSHSLQLAPGKYTIVENNANVDGYKLTTSFAPDYNVEVKAGANTAVVATNTYEKKLGTLTISKELKGDLAATDFDKPFSFTVWKGTTEIETFDLWTGHSHSLQLAPGKYTIVENNANVDGYKLTTSYAPNYIVEVKADEEITVVATNTYEKITGTVTIDKVLKGLNPTDFEDGFAFEIKDASGKVVATVEKVFPGMATPATVTLDPGKYTIVEKNADVKDYDLTTEYDKETFTVEAGKNVTVTVTNTYTKQVTPPPAEYTLSVDIQKNIELKRSSSRKPGKASFTFEAYLVDEKGNETILDTVTIDTKGTKSADGTLTFTLTDNDLSVTGHGTVYVREVKGSTRGWTYDDTVYALGVELTTDGKLNIISVDTKRIDKPATLEFTNVYYKRSTTTGGGDKPIQSVKTGDMGIAMYAMTSLLSLGGAALVIKKRREEK